MTTEQDTRADQQIRAALAAIYVVFSLNGLALASWLARIPTVKIELGLSAQSLGLVLLVPATGALLGPQLAARLVARVGSARVVGATALAQAVGLAVTGLASSAGLPLLIPALLVLGLAIGMCGVAMNVEGANVERHAGRSIMPRLHGAWSVGALVGALLTAGASALGVGLLGHLSLVGLVVAPAMVLATRRFLRADPRATQRAAASSERDGSPWREPRTLLLGVLVLVMGFSEGTGADWLGVTVVESFGASTTVGSLTYALFVAAATVVRFAGPPVIDRFGRVRVLRTGAVVSMAGVLIVVFSSSLPLAIIGAVAWGAGISLGFPLGISAAADDPTRAAARVSVVASIAQAAFLCGPPFVGWLAERLGGSVQNALTVVAVLLVVGSYAAGAAAPMMGAVASPNDPAGTDLNDPVETVDN